MRITTTTCINAYKSVCYTHHRYCTHYTHIMPSQCVMYMMHDMRMTHLICMPVSIHHSHVNLPGVRALPSDIQGDPGGCGGGAAAHA